MLEKIIYYLVIILFVIMSIISGTKKDFNSLGMNLALAIFYYILYLRPFK